jgi:hypothetical protein
MNLNESPKHMLIFQIHSPLNPIPEVNQEPQFNVEG